MASLDLLSPPCPRCRPRTWPASVLAFIVLRPPTPPTPLLPATQGLLPQTRPRKEKLQNQERGGGFERKSLRSSSRMLEKLSSSSSIIIGNDLLVVSRRKSSKATLSVAIRLRLETELHWLRRALSLVRNLRDFQEYLENGHRPLDTSNHRLRNAYLVYIYMLLASALPP
jgi:hypothetical protein